MIIVVAVLGVGARTRRQITRRARAIYGNAKEEGFVVFKIFPIHDPENTLLYTSFIAVFRPCVTGIRRDLFAVSLAALVERGIRPAALVGKFLLKGVILSATNIADAIGIIFFKNRSAAYRAGMLPAVFRHLLCLLTFFLTSIIRQRTSRFRDILCLF